MCVDMSLSGDSSLHVSNVETSFIASSRPCDIVCSKCGDIVIPSNDSHRDDIKTFLSTSFEGRRVLSHFEFNNKELDADSLSTLTRLIINRECEKIEHEKNVHVGNPLKKLE